MVFDIGNGDLSNSLATRRLQSELRQQALLSGERLSSGQKSGLEIAREGQTELLFSIEKELKNIEGYELAVNQGVTRYNSIQFSLGDIRQASHDFSLELKSALSGGVSPDLALGKVENADNVLRRVLSSLNQSISGKSLFSGSALTSSAVVDADVIVQDVENLLSSAPDVSTAMSAIDFYFNDPSGGFSTSSYTGSSIDAPALQISDRKVVSQDVRADHPAIRKVIQDLSIIAAVSNGGVVSIDDKKQLLDAATEGGLKSNDALIALQQGIGEKQNLLENVSIELNTTRGIYETSHSRASSVDLFEEATKFESIQIQLETSYKVMVRLSSLSLSNFIS